MDHPLDGPKIPAVHMWPPVLVDRDIVAPCGVGEATVPDNKHPLPVPRGAVDDLAAYFGIAVERWTVQVWSIGDWRAVQVGLDGRTWARLDCPPDEVLRHISIAGGVALARRIQGHVLPGV